MKILAFFIDAMGAQYLNVCNSEQRNTVMDDFIREVGGTVYDNCYTPAPDTPRSSACMWSGVYPKKNHCSTRVRWPKDSLNGQIENIWEILDKENYTTNIFLNDSSEVLGLIPRNENQNIYGDTIYDFFENAQITENSFNFFYLSDIHYAMDEVGFTEYGYREGINIQVRILKEIWKFYNVDETFDYVLMFSDHGFHIKEKEYKHILDKDRVKTFMYLKRKNENALTMNHILRSNMDIMPTICDIIGYKIKGAIDGKSLFSKRGHMYVLMEDMPNFSVEISQSVEHWCVVTKEQRLHWLNCDGQWEHEENTLEFNEEKYEHLIILKMNDYKKNRELYSTSQRYRKYAIEHLQKDCYSDGEKFYPPIYKLNDEKVFYGKKVVLYAAGKVGNDYYRQLKANSNIEIVGRIDINYRQIGESGVMGIDSLFHLKYDYLLICLNDKKSAIQVKEMLIQIGIDKETIVWRKPMLVRNKVKNESTEHERE